MEGIVHAKNKTVFNEETALKVKGHLVQNNGK